MATGDVVRVPMTETEKADGGERLARLLAEHEALVSARKKAMKDADEDIEEHQAIIDALATDLREGRQEKAQLDMFVEVALPKDQAAATLVEVAVIAGEEIVAEDAPLAAALTPRMRRRLKADEPHHFQGTGGAAGLCWCEKGEADIIHAPQGEEAVAQAKDRVLDA